MTYKKLSYFASAAVLLSLSVSPALAYQGSGSSGISVENYNSAFVGNFVTTSANTGGNVAYGGNGGDAGQGGSVIDSDDDNYGGKGGSAGAGGEGGAIISGAAVANTSILNEANTVKTLITDTCCEESIFENDRYSRSRPQSRSIKVKNENQAALFNAVATVADTGYNAADGGNAGNAGTGGSVEDSDDDNCAGNGGAGGVGGLGGVISTGESSAESLIVNKLNKVVTRISRGFAF